MKTKFFIHALAAVFIVAGAVAATKIIKVDYKLIRLDFLNHAKGKTQHFINSLIS